jgi:hypothetical protein
MQVSRLHLLSGLHVERWFIASTADTVNMQAAGDVSWLGGCQEIPHGSLPSHLTPGQEPPHMVLYFAGSSLLLSELTPGKKASEVCLQPDRPRTAAGTWAAHIRQHSSGSMVYPVHAHM